MRGDNDNVDTETHGCVMAGMSDNMSISYTQVWNGGETGVCMGSGGIGLSHWHGRHILEDWFVCFAMVTKDCGRHCGMEIRYVGGTDMGNSYLFYTRLFLEYSAFLNILHLLVSLLLLHPHLFLLFSISLSLLLRKYSCCSTHLKRLLAGACGQRAYQVVGQREEYPRG